MQPSRVTAERNFIAAWRAPADEVMITMISMIY